MWASDAWWGLGARSERSHIVSKYGARPREALREGPTVDRPDNMLWDLPKRIEEQPVAWQG